MEKREGGRMRGRGVWKKGREGGGGEGGMEKKEGGREGVRRIREEGRGMEITGKEGGRKRQREGGCKNK